MKISIITVVLNACTTIKETITSVLSQTYKDVEHIIIDGGSTDGTADIVKSYGNKITKFVSERDKGVYDAMNKGIALATGEVVGILNADDFYAHDRVIETVMERMKDSAVECCYGDFAFVDQKGVKIIRLWKSGGRGTGLFLKQGWAPPHSTFFAKAFVYKQYGYFDTRYQIAADYDIMLRFLLDHNISASYIQEILVKGHIGGISNRGFRNLFRKSSEDLRILRKHGVRSPFLVLMAKNISKLPQFFFKEAA